MSLNQHLPVEVMYMVQKRFRQLSPPDASVEEYVTLVMLHAQSNGKERNAEGQLTLSLYMGKDEFVALARGMDPVGKMKQQLSVSSQILPAPLVDHLSRGASRNPTAGRTGSRGATTGVAATMIATQRAKTMQDGEYEEAKGGERPFAGSLMQLVDDEEALINGTGGGGGGGGLGGQMTFLQRWALAEEARGWLAESQHVEAELIATSVPVMDHAVGLGFAN